MLSLTADKVKDYFQLAASHRDWRAIRVDLVGSTTTQYAYAQIGWTGNKQYNRCLRQYAKDSLGYSLSSTGLYDTRQVGLSLFKKIKCYFNLASISYGSSQNFLIDFFFLVS